MKWLIKFVRSSLSRRLSFWVVVLVAAIFTAAFALMFSETRDVVREEAWDKAYAMISRSLMTVTEASDTRIKGTIDAGEGGVFVTSIPFEEGWSMKIDGRRTKIGELTGGAWISAGLKEGTHEIELSFRPAGLINGLLLTILSILVLIGAIHLPTVIRRRRFLKEVSDCSTE